MSDLDKQVDKIYDDYWNHPFFKKLEKPRTENLTIEQCIEKYGHMSTDEQIKILRNHEAKTRRL